MRKGFTLIELLVVIGILGVLTTVSFVILNPAGQLQKSRDSKRKADLQQIRAALELYRSDNGSYPASGWVYSTAGDYWISGLTPNYLKTVPKDPLNTSSPPWNVGSYSYAYESVSDCNIPAGTAYILTAKLENTNDPQRNNNIQYGTCSWPAVAGLVGLYTVGSP